MKVIIAGSRNYNDYEKLEKVVDHILGLFKGDVIIISGCARGADTLGIEYAERNNLPVKLIPADWDKYGKSAGYLRNEEMAKEADALIAFWDGKSKGTKHMIDLAKEQGLGTSVIKI